MKLHIDNFLKIANADILLDGLTVLAGDNNTGKSTVGKVLYSVFDVYSSLNDRIDRARCHYVINPGRFPPLRDLNIAALLDDSSLSEESLFHLLRGKKEIHFARIWTDGFDKDQNPLNEDEWTRQFAKELYARILKARSIPRTRWEEFEVGTELERIFHSSCFTMCRPDSSDADIVLNVKNKNINIHLTEHSLSSRSEIVLFHKAWFVGSPDLLDTISRGSTHDCMDRAAIPLVKELIARNSPEAVDALLSNELLKDIWQKLQKYLPGYFKLGRDDQTLVIQSEEFPAGLPVEALSMGLKTFALLRLMLERGVLQDEDVLILDEPENHLHPEWQIIYAQLLILLQKALRLTLLITSHSDFFVNALQRFSISEGIAERTHFYLTMADEAHPGFYTFDDRGIMTGPIFRSFNKAYERLSTMSGETDDDEA